MLLATQAPLAILVCLPLPLQILSALASLRTCSGRSGMDAKCLTFLMALQLQMIIVRRCRPSRSHRPDGQHRLHWEDWLHRSSVWLLHPVFFATTICMSGAKDHLWIRVALRVACLHQSTADDLCINAGLSGSTGSTGTTGGTGLTGMVTCLQVLMLWFSMPSRCQANCSCGLASQVTCAPSGNKEQLLCTRRLDRCHRRHRNHRHHRSMLSLAIPPSLCMRHHLKDCHKEDASVTEWLPSTAEQLRRMCRANRCHRRNRRYR